VFTLSKYISKNGQWVTPEETSGSIQNTSSNVTIEVTVNAEDNQGLILAPMQIVNFEGTIYVKSSSDRDASFTVVPFKVSAGGGGRYWTANTEYPKGVFVIYRHCLYKCTATHTSGITFSDTCWYKVGVSNEGDTFTGPIFAPTPASTSNDTNIATTAWVKNYTSGTCTNSSSVSGGNIRWYKNGRMATITLFNVKTSTTSSGNIQLAADAPRAIADMYTTAITISGKTALVHVNATGSVVIYNNLTTTEGFFGTITYPTSDVT